MSVANTYVSPFPMSRRVMNLSHFLRAIARRLPDKTGLVWRDREWTWAEIDARVDAMATALASSGVRKGDRVLIHSMNCNAMFESMFVCWRLGAIWVPGNYRQTPAEVAHLAEASGASALICHAKFADHAAAVSRIMPASAPIIYIGKCGFGLEYEHLVNRCLGQECADADVDRDDPCWFFFTSGTTGRPKAAVLTHGQMGFVATNHLSDLMPGLSEDRDASLVVAPLSHGAGIHQLAQVARGVKSILLPTEGLDPSAVWELVAKWRVTNLFTVPTIVKILTEDSSVDRFDHSSLKHVIYAGAPMYREDQRHALRKLGKVLIQYYGLGEVTGAITVLPACLHDANDDSNVLIGSCGFERTAMQVSIQDQEGRTLRAGETGEICVSGLAVFAGYYNNPEANEKAFRNGWFRTGDLGYQNEQGFLFITGRLTDMYISGGSNVYPREIEEKLLAHPAVAEVAVVGVPDPLWGESGVAVAVLRDGAQCDESELLNFISGQIARYKTPKRILFWSELPKSAYGKIEKKTVKQQLEARGQWLGSAIQ